LPTFVFYYEIQPSFGVLRRDSTVYSLGGFFYQNVES